MTRIHTSLERWRYSIGLLTTSTLIAQLLTSAHGQPIEPIEGMGEIKREIREKAETIDIQKRKLDEERAKVSELQKEVERLEAEIISAMAVVDNQTERSTAEVIDVEATFYTAFCSTGCTGITASGLDVSSTIYTPEGYRVIAVDPSVIALGSIVRVTLANGDSFEAKAEDTGGAIHGNRIDVLVSDEATAYSLGRQSATVEIINE